jgi:hypothetical protein
MVANGDPVFVIRRTTTAIIYLLAAVADSFLLLWASHQSLNEPSRIEIALCVLAVVMFALAAGLVSRRPRVAHICAVAGVAGLPWLYTTTLHGNIYVNLWILFNVPDKERRFYDSLAIENLVIFAAGLIVIAIATGILRLLPGRWGQRTWPAFAASLCFLAVWYSQSVMPYRIPGALDYSRWPMLQILHVQKRRLQFHETCVKIWGYRGTPESVSIAWNDRRLFAYRFQEWSGHLEVPKALGERIVFFIQSSPQLKSNPEPVKPLRSWNDEGWYVTGEEIRFQAYTKENRSIPTQEMVDLFNDIAKLPPKQVASEDRKDVCLGLCYDPVSELGALYANHRCRYEETSRDYVCR